MLGHSVASHTLKVRIESVRNNQQETKYVGHASSTLEAAPSRVGSSETVRASPDPIIGRDDDIVHKREIQFLCAYRRIPYPLNGYTQNKVGI